MRVGILAYPGVALFELSCAVELFALPRPEFAHWYQTQVISLESSPLATTAGLTLSCEQVADFADFDMLIIPSWPVAQAPSSALSFVLKQFAQRNGRILSFCSGAFLLGYCGLLANRKATTHWRYADDFQQTFADSNYVDDVLYVYDGQIGCSAGSAAGLDLGLEVIRQDFGQDKANAVARRLVVAAHRSGGQSQFVQKPLAPLVNRFSQTLEWAIKHLDKDLNVDKMAAHASMSRRSFDRHFRATLNITPAQWLNERRIENAKSLLETSQYSLEQVAQSAGFDNPITMRQLFRKQLNLSPSRYREQFNAQQKVS